MAKTGRKSLKEELNVVRYMSELAPSVFRVIREELQNGDRKWAVEQMSKLYAKAVPQKIGGDPNNNTPIPISILQGASQKVKVDA